VLTTLVRPGRTVTSITLTAQKRNTDHHIDAEHVKIKPQAGIATRPPSNTATAGRSQTFAVGCLLRWYREGLDPSARLHHLSTFMGHVDPVSTAVYQTITPQLLEEASRRFEVFAEPAWAEVTR